METVRRVAKNTAAMLSSHLVGMVCSLIFVIFRARYLESVGFGKYAFALSFVAISAVFLDLGLNTIAIREVSKDRSQAGKYMGNLLFLRVLLGAGMLSLVYAMINLMGYPRETMVTVYLLGAGAVMAAMASGLRFCFHAYQKLEYEAVLGMGTNVAIVGGSLWALLAGYKIVALASVNLGVSLLFLAVSYLVVIKRFAPPLFRIDLGLLRTLLKEALPVAVTIVFATIYCNVDIVMLSKMKGDEVTGWYSAAYRILALAKTLAVVYIAAIFPVMSDYFHNHRENFKKVIQKSYQLMFFVGLITATLLTLLADRVVILLYGSEFAPAAAALHFLSWGALFMFLSQISGHALISCGKQKINAWACGLGLFLNVILNLLFIPKLGHIGASLSIFIAEIVVALSVMYYIYRYFRVTLSVDFAVKALLSAGLTILLIDSFAGLNLFILLGLGLIFYLLIFLLIKGVSSEDKLILRQLLPIRTKT